MAAISIIGVAIEQGIKERPTQAAADMLMLMQENARLEEENAMLNARVAHLVGLDWTPSVFR
jgi:hypothetical protein